MELGQGLLVLGDIGLLEFFNLTGSGHFDPHCIPELLDQPGLVFTTQEMRVNQTAQNLGCRIANLKPKCE